MTRIILAIATVVFASASLFTTAAQACISCNYTPEVVNTPNPNAARRNKYKTNQAKKPRAPAASKSARKKQPAAQAPATQAKAKPAPAPAPREEAAKAEPVTDEVAKTETSTPESGPRLTGSSALMQHSIPKQEEPVTAADAEGACKRFIPAVGATVSVACD